MITRQQLEIINRWTLKYPLHVAEKDYFLALVLKLMVDSELGKVLVFKGGTAIHHCYLDLEKYSLNLAEIIGYMQLKEIRKPITKENISKNWAVIGTQKEAEMMQIYYSRVVADEEIMTLIERLPIF